HEAHDDGDDRRSDGDGQQHESPLREFDRDFDDDVNGHTLPLRRRKAPLPHRLNRAIVQAATKSVDHPDVSNCTVAPDDNFKCYLACESALTRLFGVVRLDLVQEPRRLNAAARTVRSAAGAAAASRPDPSAVALAQAGPGSASGAATLPGTATVDVRRGLL